jgi:hypothetical protein
MKKYRVGDPVWYTPRAGIANVATITNIELTTRPDEKYGEQVDEVEVDTELFVMDVRLIVAPPAGKRYDMDKWARPDQVHYMSDTDRQRYVNINPNQDD